LVNLLKQTIEEQELIALKFKYHPDALFMYSIGVNDKFYFGVEEYDFELSGYQIRKTSDIENFIIVDNYSSKINELEGLKEEIVYYPINLTSFETIFNYLKETDQIISIEREYGDEDGFFLIGKIVKVTEDEIWFKDFNINGVWNEELNIVPFEIITTIRFNSKYINTWTKYIKWN